MNLPVDQKYIPAALPVICTLDQYMKLNGYITIRKVTSADLVLLSGISRATYRETFFEAFNDPDAFDAYTDELFAVARMKAELENPDIVFYFAMYGEQPVGYIKVNTGQAQTIFQGDAAAELERIYVVNAYQGHHIGKALLLHAMDITADKKKKFLWLGVWENNGKAITFYERNAFRKFTTHDYLVGDDRQTDWLMKIEL